VVYTDGEFTRINRKDVLEALRKNVNRPLTDRERFEQEASKQLVPALVDYYRGYDT